jgi:xanthine dehydrogenase accessory factor
MQDHHIILAAYEDWRGAPMALATVVSTWGSAPRPRGSHMLVHADGRFAGSVSGGCVEGDVLAVAGEVIASGRSERRRYGVSDASAFDAGLPCGGTIEVMVQPVADHGFPPALLDLIIAGRSEGRTVAVATDLATGESAVVGSDDAEAFVNRYTPQRRLFIVGAVQIAQSLAAIARSLDIHPIVIDPRGRFLTEQRFPDTMLDDRWPDEAITAGKPDMASAVITLSHDPKIDDPALVAALAHPTGYIAALGSRRSHAARRDRLAAAGVAAADLDRIEGPAGIDIGAIGAAEIALSIAAGMIAAWHRRAE